MVEGEEEEREGGTKGGRREGGKEGGRVEVRKGGRSSVVEHLQKAVCVGSSPTRAALFFPKEPILLRTVACLSLKG